MRMAKVDDEEYDPEQLSAEGKTQLFLLQSVDVELKRAYAQIAVLKAARDGYDEENDMEQQSVEALIESMDAEVKRAYAQIAVLKNARAIYVKALQDAVAAKLALN